MNRPKIEDFPYCYSVINNIMYKDALEKYCDELEEKNNVLIESNNNLSKENAKLVKALDNACKYLANPWVCKVFNRYKRMWSYLDWKIWAFKDEK